jgi:hypothetical protein
MNDPVKPTMADALLLEEVADAEDVEEDSEHHQHGEVGTEKQDDALHGFPSRVTAGAPGAARSIPDPRT